MYSNEFLNGPVPEIEQPAGKQSEPSITAKITRYLRWIGSVLIVFSAVSFMLQGHDNIQPSYRYWIGLSLTLLLCAGGLICAYLFKETKGARIFFGLGTAFLSVQISQVSAMIYAYWHGHAALQPQYRWLQFMDVNPTVIALDFIISTALLVIVSYASYSILARKFLKKLLWISIVGNAFLMMPIRDAEIMPWLIAALFILLRMTERELHQNTSMQLPEGMAARALVSLPLWIMIGRSLLHPTSYTMAIVLSAIVVIYSIYDIHRYTRSAYLIYTAQWVGTGAAIGIWMIVMNQMELMISGHFDALLPIALILFILSTQVMYHARLYRFLSSILTVLLTFSAMMYHQSLAPIFAIASGILLTIAGMKYREKIPFVIGNLCVSAGILFYWDYAFDLYSSAPWMCSIAIGLIVILLASYLENKEQQILAKSRYYFKEFKNWN